MSNLLTLGQRIRELRMKHGMTQIELAAGICTPSMISQVESDRAKPSYRMLFSITDRLQVPMEKLLEHVELGIELKSKFTLAKALIESGQHRVASSLLEQLLQEQRTDISTADLMYWLAVCYMNTEQYPKAETMFSSVAEWATVRDDRQLLARSMLGLSDIATHRKEYSLAIYHTQKALDEHKKSGTGDPVFHIDILFQLATLNEQIGMMARAETYLQEAAKMFESMSDLKGLGSTYLQLAEACQKQAQFERAHDYAAQALRVYKTIGDQSTMMDTERQLIVLQSKRENTPADVDRLIEFATVYELASDPQRAAEIYAEIANICLEEQNFDEAWAYAEKARLILPIDHPVLGRVHRILAFVYFARNEPDKGFHHLDLAANIYETNDQIAQLEEVVMHLCHHLSELGRHREAFERMDRFHDRLMKKLDENGIVL